MFETLSPIFSVPLRPPSSLARPGWWLQGRVGSLSQGPCQRDAPASGPPARALAWPRELRSGVSGSHGSRPWPERECGGAQFAGVRFARLGGGEGVRRAPLDSELAEVTRPCHQVGVCTLIERQRRTSALRIHRTGSKEGVADTSGTTGENCKPRPSDRQSHRGTFRSVSCRSATDWLQNRTGLGGRGTSQ